jgi:hypothetical protein
MGHLASLRMSRLLVLAFTTVAFPVRRSFSLAPILRLMRGGFGRLVLVIF